MRDVDKLMEIVAPALEGMSESDAALTRDMLREFCWLSARCRDLEDKIDEEGLLVETEKGGVNNRHIVLAENPAVGTLHKMTARKSDYYKTLMRRLPDANADKLDDLGAFLRG
jgi:hypothetical protein